MCDRNLETVSQEKNPTIQKQLLGADSIATQFCLAAHSQCTILFWLPSLPSAAAMPRCQCSDFPEPCFKFTAQEDLRNKIASLFCDFLKPPPLHTHTSCNNLVQYIWSLGDFELGIVPPPAPIIHCQPQVQGMKMPSQGALAINSGRECQWSEKNSIGAAPSPPSLPAIERVVCPERNLRRLDWAAPVISDEDTAKDSDHFFCSFLPVLPFLYRSPLGCFSLPLPERGRLAHKDQDLEESLPQACSRKFFVGVQIFW